MEEMTEEIKDLVKKILASGNAEGERKLKAKRQLRNKFFRKYVLEKFGYKCVGCGTNGRWKHICPSGKRKSNPLQLHHKDYDWDCPYLLSSESKTKRAMTSVMFSDCRECYGVDRSRFESCVEKCIVLCDMCHFRVHYKRIKKDSQLATVDAGKVTTKEYWKKFTSEVNSQKD